jgi:hypothetical protein
MGMFDWLSMTPKEKKLQFFIHDDDSMEFRKLPVEDTVLIEMRGGKPVAAFKHYYKLEYDFNGYKNIPSGKISLAYPRDVMLDLFNSLEDSDKFTKGNNLNSLEDSDKFTKGNNLNRPWITAIAANSFYKAKTQKPPSLMMDRFTTACIIIAAAEGIGIVARLLIR